MRRHQASALAPVEVKLGPALLGKALMTALHAKMAGAESLGHNVMAMGFDKVLSLLSIQSQGQIDRVGKYAISDVESALETWRQGPRVSNLRMPCVVHVTVLSTSVCHACL